MHYISAIPRHVVMGQPDEDAFQFDAGVVDEAQLCICPFARERESTYFRSGTACSSSRAPSVNSDVVILGKG